MRCKSVPKKAKEATNNGIAAMGISEDKIIVLTAEDEEQPVSQTNLVLTLTDSTPAVAVVDLQYYEYRYKTTNNNFPYFANSSLEVDVGRDIIHLLEAVCRLYIGNHVIQILLKSRVINISLLISA